MIKNNLSLKQLQHLLTVDTHTASVFIGNVTAKKHQHGEVRVVTHDTRDNLIPWNEPKDEVRGPVGNQREALRKSMKYLGLLSCGNCATEFTDNGFPRNGKGRMYEDYKTGERWCYVCGLRS